MWQVCDGAVCSFEFNSCPGFYIEIDPEAQLTHEACTDEVLKISYFLDTNKNQIQDVGEESIEVNESFVKIKDDHDVFLFFDNNQECFLVEPRTYELEFINENFIPSNLPQFITIEDDEGTRELHIALCVNEDLPVNDLDIRIAALLTERCNRVVPLRIKLTNIGNTAIRDTFTLNYDTLIEKRTVDLPSVTSIPGQIQWIIDLPNPLQTQEITVNFKMPTAEYTGDIFCLSPKFNLSDSDFTEHCFTLRCPYDPNDKKGQPLRGGDNPVLNEEEFLYTIRFENLGNDTAFNVRIEDTLSTFLNASTFRYIQSSHDISRYYVNNDRVAKLYFDNINLVSIAQDSTLNKGFVQYAIKMNEDLSPNTVINNEAFIYFDDNAFVKNK